MFTRAETEKNIFKKMRSNEEIKTALVVAHKVEGIEKYANYHRHYHHQQQHEQHHHHHRRSIFNHTTDRPTATEKMNQIRILNQRKKGRKMRESFNINSHSTHKICADNTVAFNYNLCATNF